MRYRSVNDALPLDEMEDPKLRKNIFREMGRDLSQSITERRVTDRPGAIARLMEKAYQAGLKMAHEDTHVAKMPKKAEITDMDLPSRTRQALSYFRRAMFPYSDAVLPEPDFADTPAEHLNHAAFVILFETRDFRDSTGTYKNNQWIIPTRRNPVSFAQTTLSGLFKNDLYHIQKSDLPFEYATLTEWGYELLATGATKPIEDRKFGTSSTFDVWQQVSGIANPPPLALALHTYGRISDEQFERLIESRNNSAPMP